MNGEPCVCESGSAVHRRPARGAQAWPSPARADETAWGPRAGLGPQAAPCALTVARATPLRAASHGYLQDLWIIEETVVKFLDVCDYPRYIIGTDF